MPKHNPKPFASEKRSIDNLLKHGQDGVDAIQVLSSYISQMGGPKAFGAHMASLSLDPDASKQVKVSMYKLATQLMTNPAVQAVDQTDIATFSDEELEDSFIQLMTEDSSFREKFRRALADFDAKTGSPNGAV